MSKNDPKADALNNLYYSYLSGESGPDDTAEQMVHALGGALNSVDFDKRGAFKIGTKLIKIGIPYDKSRQGEPNKAYELADTLAQMMPGQCKRRNKRHNSRNCNLNSLIITELCRRNHTNRNGVQPGQNKGFSKNCRKRGKKPKGNIGKNNQ